MTVTNQTKGTVSVPLWATETFDLVTVDFMSHMATFREPDTGAAIATVGFGLLDHIEALASSQQPEPKHALLFTANGLDWSLQDLDEVIGPTHEPSGVALLGDRVVLLTVPKNSPGPAAPRLKVHVGTIP